jgi:Ca2+-binding RTX toxin-like protein
MAIFGTTGDDKLEGTEIADTIIAYAGDDELHGKGGNDLLSGDDGNDKLFGEAGNDLLYGGLDVGRDSDTLDGGSGIDTVTYSQVQPVREFPFYEHGMGVDLAQGRATALFHDSDVVDTLVSIENVIGTNQADFLIGNGSANFLSGGGSTDRLEGRGGNDKLSGGGGTDVLGVGDLLIGGSGVDTLTGGTDPDTFMYVSTNDSGVGLGNRDLITDFQPGLEHIKLYDIDAKVGTVGDQNFKFIGKDTFTAEGQVRFFFEGDHTVVALNTSGTSGAESQIELTGLVNVSGGDFLL